MIDAEGVVQGVEQACHRVGGDRDVELLQQLGDLLRRLAGPLQAGDGVSRGIVFQQDLDGVDYFGRFFSACWRPPPALRTRPNSTSWASNCCRPRATV